ncbi:MAG TPA: hypothetical protein VGJ95_21620 [Pseudonocardiaceae bacterium]
MTTRRGTTVALAFLFDIPGMTSEQYDEVCRNLNNGQPFTSLSQWPEAGIISHVAGPTSGGWRVLDVWESEEAFQRFGEKLVPLLKQAGAPDVQPQVFPVHNVVTQ